MLLFLSIKNYALIEDLELDFREGFTAITGETGSGKSILLEALKLACGERADTSAIRHGCDICVITASFSFTNSDIKKFLNDLGILQDDNIINIRRAIERSGPTGRSKAFINDCPVNVSTLAALGAMLVDLHDQDEKYSLNLSQVQASILDSCIDGAGPLLAKIKSSFEKMSALKSELKEIDLSDKDRQQKIDLYKYQVNEIEEAALTENEEAELEQVLPQLKNAEKISESLGEAVTLLYSSDNSALSVIDNAKKKLETAASLGAATGDLVKLLDEAYYQVEEVYRGADAIFSGIDINPEKLNTALVRQDLIKKLKKKYGPAILDIFAHLEKVKNELDMLSNSQDSVDRLEKEIEVLNNALSMDCEILSKKRHDIASSFSENVRRQLEELEISNAVFDVSISAKEPSANGADKIDFMFSANKGEAVLPLKDIASGGEMSRVMLAIELSSKFNIDQSAIFDEIDTGTGGKAGDKIGKKLLELASKKQVFSVTHLAQCAAFADTHIKIYKEDSGGRTYTKAKILTPQEHIAEIARMISGEQISPSALAHAETLIASAKKR